MPTLNPPPPGSNVPPPLEQPAASHLHGVLVSPHIYLALGVIAVLLAARFASYRPWPLSSSIFDKSWARRTTKTEQKGPQAVARKDPTEQSYSKRNSPAPVRECSPALDAKTSTSVGLAKLGYERDYYCSVTPKTACPPAFGFGFGQEQSPAHAQAVWAAGLLPPVVARPGLLAGHQQQLRHYQQRVMDGHDNGDHQQSRNPSGPGPAAHPSRAVSILSTSATGLRRHDNNPSPTAAAAGGSGAASRPGSHSGQRRRSSSRRSPRSRLSSSPQSEGKQRDGAAGHDSYQTRAADGNEFGIGLMESLDGGSTAAASNWTRTVGSPHSADVAHYADNVSAVGPAAYDMDFSALSRHFARPPPPPPLTPPTLSASMFAFENRRHGYAVSIPPDFEVDTAEFIRQPNPDYVGAASGADIVGVSAASSDPRGVATIPRRRSYTKAVAVGIPMQGTAQEEQDPFSPSSYPPTSPLLPPPPPEHELPYDFEGYGDGHAAVGGQGEIDLQGEIISVMNDAGHGWKRHTRVYGGGVCLACLSSGGEHGGFYGDTVPPEHKR